MTTQIKMPQLGESVTEGTISKWFVKPGDKVIKYDPIAEVITDKVNAEIPSSYTGVIQDLLVAEDETVAVGAVICTIVAEGEELVVSEKIEANAEKHLPSLTDEGEKKRFSPAVLRLAEEYKIDLAVVNGTGRGGRITRKDLFEIIASGKLPAAIKTEQLPQRQAELQVPAEQPLTTEKKLAAGDLELPLTPVRKAIAANMLKSKREAPHAWTMVEADVTNLVHLRNKRKQAFAEKEGFSLTFLPFFIKAVVEALREFPQLNSVWAEDKIIQKKDINISIAVATDDALFVPVIKRADELSLKGIAKEMNSLAAKVRNKTITSSEMQGGTFTINNTGSFGSILSAPIINYPQAAILSVEAIVKRPIVLENDAIAIRHMVNLCLSLDHRILDGLVCGRFLAKVKERLQFISEENNSIY